MREHGFARLKVGTPDDRAPHREGNFPTPTGKCMLKVEGATNFVAPPFRQMYEGSSPAKPSIRCRITSARVNPTRTTRNSPSVSRSTSSRPRATTS